MNGIKRFKVTLYYKKSKKTFKIKQYQDRKKDDFNNELDFTVKLRRRFYKALSLYSSFFSLFNDKFSFNFSNKSNSFFLDFLIIGKSLNG